MAEAILYGIAQEVLKNLGSRAINEFASTWRFKARLEELKKTTKTISNVLLDAEEKQSADDGHAVRGWLQELSTVVYAADDLFDEFNTIVSRKQRLGGNKVSNEVRTFFSTSNQVAVAFKLSRKIKSIREKLEYIRKDGAELGLAQRALQQGSAITVRRETHCFVDTKEIVGRDADKEAILDILLASGSTENEIEHEPKVLPIVGLGGMGKTTLAQLVYNDDKVEKSFDLKLWVCVGDSFVGKNFDEKVIIEKILKAATKKGSEKLELNELVGELRKEVDCKKFLLVLDDMWEDDPVRGGELMRLLKMGRNGSRILVTTRSRKVAAIMGTSTPHLIQELSEKMSWDLFEKLAFKSGEAQQKPELANLGKELLKKCANVPLAIVSLGRLLRCEPQSKWSSFKDKNLDNATNVLKLSYQHLSSPLKNCFAYCALFPKD